MFDRAGPKVVGSAAAASRAAPNTPAPDAEASEAEHLVADLRWPGAELAPARDGEVLATHITAAIDALPDEQLLGPVSVQEA